VRPGAGGFDERLHPKNFFANATTALKFTANNLPMLTTLRIKNLALEERRRYGCGRGGA
jgi:hypothetical protein